jgi:predicted GNAT family N-acyltransferase
MRWIHNFDEEYHDQLFDLYIKEWWTKGRLQSDVISAFENSDIVFGCLTDDDQLIACARVLSDFTFKALMFDVIISENHRGEGLGRVLLDKITGHEKLKNVKSFELYCPDHIAPFYEKYGFSKSSSNLLTLQR